MVGAFGRCEEAGQAMVEAAFLIPVVFCVLLLLIQPGIVLYDRMVMQAAATDACRLLMTKTDVSGDMSGSVDAFIRHRLGSIPPVDCFHVHGDECSWEIETEGDECSDHVRVAISGRVKPLPLLDIGTALAGSLNDDGTLTVRVEHSRQSQPDWVSNAVQGASPKDWIGAWAR